MADHKNITEKTDTIAGYTPEAISFFEYFLMDKQHLIRFELYKLRKIGHCTIEDVDLRWHIESYIAKHYWEYRDEEELLNKLLQELGLPTVEKDYYDDKDGLFVQHWDILIEYIQRGIYQSLEWICNNPDDLDEFSEGFNDIKHYDKLIPDEDFVKPEHYPSAMRNLLYDCFCYIYPELEWTSPRTKEDKFYETEYIERKIGGWLMRICGCDYDENSASTICFCLICEKLGVDITEDLSSVGPCVFQHGRGITSLKYLLLKTDLPNYIRNCIYDLLNEFIEEYKKEEFYKVPLLEFAKTRE